MGGKGWSSKELELLEMHFPSQGPTGTSNLLQELGFNRSPGAVGDKAARLGYSYKEGSDWKGPELAILRTHYTKRGAVYVQRRLEEEGYKRTIKAIQSKAQEAFLYRGHTRGYVPLAWVAKYPNGLGLYQLLKRAKRDGALHDSGNPNDRVRYMVKESWADQVILERIQGEQ